MEFVYRILRNPVVLMVLAVIINIALQALKARERDVLGRNVIQILIALIIIAQVNMFALLTQNSDSAKRGLIVSTKMKRFAFVFMIVVV
jgi:hypothetical protein